MAKIRVRKETGKLFYDFQFDGDRYREQTRLEDTPANRKQLEAHMAAIEYEIHYGQFDYAKHFPGSPNLRKLKTEVTKLAALRFNTYADMWMAREAVRRQWSDSYQDTVKGWLGTRVRKHFGEMGVDQITEEDVHKFRENLLLGTSKAGERINPNYINQLVKIVLEIVKSASKEYKFAWVLGDLKYLKSVEPKIVPLSLDEIAKILDVATPFERSYTLFRCFTGLRTCEVHGLKWCYVDLQNRTIEVAESFVKDKMTGTKTRMSTRIVALPDMVVVALADQFTRSGAGEFVFPKRNGQPYKSGEASKQLWYPLLDRAGVMRRRPYHTRHTAFSLMLAMGENPTYVARVAGHTGIQTLLRKYVKYIANAFRQDGSNFNKGLGDKLNPEPPPE